MAKREPIPGEILVTYRNPKGTPSDIRFPSDDTQDWWEGFVECSVILGVKWLNLPFEDGGIVSIPTSSVLEVRRIPMGKGKG
jgi:hypothetical protein